MSLPALNDQATLRRWAPSIVTPSAGGPLIRSTQDLQVRLTWMDGTVSCDWDFPAKATPEQARRFLIGAMRKLIAWKSGGDDGKGGQGYQFISLNKRPPTKGWHKFPSMNFWWTGPVEAIVLGGYVYRGDKGERDFDGTKGPWNIGRTLRSGEAHLNDTGGKVAYRVGGWFLVREWLNEVPA